MKPRVALIGPGRLGQAVGALLRQQGYPISAIVGRDPDKTRLAAEFIGAEFMATTDLRRCAAAEIILVTVADDQLQPVARQLAAALPPQEHFTLIHFSGHHAAEILRPPQSQPTPQWNLLSIHPLQTFATARQGLSSLNGCYCSVEGATALQPLAYQLVKDFGATPFTISAEHKSLYHAAACMVSNFVTTLFHDASTLMAHCMDDQALAGEILKPLLQTATQNTLQLGPEQALTGPIVRGDAATITDHLEQLTQHQPQLVAVYRQLGLRTVELARSSQRLDKQDAETIARLLTADDV
ncbi:MAG: DUF2520 domain-containing protein [Desulfuromonas sp.]|nr:DUF2520 domain-containing protein [Desulfuromonas sp.]